MHESDRHRPRAATCEDWDEDTQSALPGSQTSANVSAKRSQHDLALRQRSNSEFDADGGDSGYVSRAGTVAGESTSGRRKMPDLKIDTAAVRERERKPYLISQNGHSQPTSRRQSSSQLNETPSEARPYKARHDAHERGPGGSHDHVKHVETRQDPSRASKAAPPPPSAGGVKTWVPKGTKDDQAVPVKVRRSSSNQQPRPMSMFSNAPVPVQYMNPPMYGPPSVATSGYATPVTPNIPYSPMPYSYIVPAPLPTPSYAVYQPQPSYFDPPTIPEPRSARPSRHPSPVRRSSAYGEPVIRQGYPESGMMTLERIPSKETRPPPLSQKSIRNLEDDDRAIMPPPPRPPQPEVVLTRRPSNRRAKTYHPQEPVLRERVVYEPERYDSDDDHDYRRSRPPPSAFRERRESSSRPPSSYRAPPLAETRDRPMPRKSVSYSAGTTVTKIASSAPHNIPRRMTVPLEEKEAQIEEYQSRRNKTSNELTAEALAALRDLEQRNSSSRSETGSNFSRQSSSKDSSGRGRSQTSGTKTSITLPGGLNMTIPADYINKDGRPLSINVGGVVVSVGAEGKENERPKEQKRIERAPSVASRNSKKSVSSSVTSARERDRDMPTSRRPSYLEERGPSLRSSRQPSRAPSTNRRSQDFSARQSVDYSYPDL
ncbi:uncharacterized protein Z520_07709 [Fonsecaea multimorphosa CBS 102226]|uniref:Uncharacterized protein n=1 Tax=Fonsecaea multimorphosa CBS 102226 TaxID=1442371 RepID=A0A0D2KIK9_9EURO|nr:uncharacterized protein Z520_07709 [Fonsecaea multimorphosa CBS 102226]KIX96443.1 hypothetical protein Z520_07709 [Fonsecaea multimorphosa CBS 102226]OAL22353.1 hypothetical protein AYO22_07397 [Fonsecaea multimorphosa]